MKLLDRERVRERGTRRRSCPWAATKWNHCLSGYIWPYAGVSRLLSNKLTLMTAAINPYDSSNQSHQTDPEKIAKYATKLKSAIDDSADTRVNSNHCISQSKRIPHGLNLCLDQL